MLPVIWLIVGGTGGLGQNSASARLPLDKKLSLCYIFYNMSLSKESMVYQIDFFDAIYTKEFYDNIIPQMGDYFHTHREKELIFNFVDLNFISPSIVPNILNIADIYKKYTDGKTISLKLSWNPKLLSYLYSIHFFDYSNTLNLFNFNREMLGGFEAYSTEENCNLIFSEVNSTEDEILKKVENLMRSMAIYKKFEKDSKDDYEKLSEIFFHLIHNANDIERGNSNAYGLFQINKYKDNTIAYISICDSGKGIPYTITKKFQNNEATPYFISNKNTSTFYYDLEALFWRKRIHSFPFRHGLYNVAQMVLRKGGKIGIHSDDMYVLFPHFFQNTFDSITDRIVQKIDLEPDLQYSLSAFARRNTMTRKYRGVHIDIEIPIGEKK